MFAKLAIFFAAFMAIFVAALPSPGWPEPAQPGIDKCANGGQVYCCNSYQKASSDATQVLTLSGHVIPTGETAGVTCSPIDETAIEKQSCSTQTACCSGNNFNGEVVLGCSPITEST